MRETLARLGLLARAAVYAIIGVLALKVALGDGGKTVNQQGALKTIAQEPAGKLLLIALAAGLAGYAAWRLWTGLTGRDAADAKDRLSGLIGAVVYGGLCFTAIKIVAGAGTKSKGSADRATGGVLGMPLGREIIAVTGAIFVFEGLSQIRQGVKRTFLEQADTGRMHAATEKAFTASGVVGYCARGVVFGLVGVFLVKAAIEFDPDEAVALDGALAKLAHATAGPVLLGIVAAGLVAFAAHGIADARYRRLD